ncbi:MAG: hypothetical protein V1735_00640 [Nanoarchaeota archaeon]
MHDTLRVEDRGFTVIADDLLESLGLNRLGVDHEAVHVEDDCLDHTSREGPPL